MERFQPLMISSRIKLIEAQKILVLFSFLLPETESSCTIDILDAYIIDINHYNPKRINNEDGAIISTFRLILIGAY